MDFQEYQRKARATAVYPDNFAMIYPVMGLVGEAGEVANKVKKLMRGDHTTGEWSMESYRLEREIVMDILDELGDVLWYLANVCEDFGLTLESVAQRNVEKLADRAERGVIKGQGDSR